MANLYRELSDNLFVCIVLTCSTEFFPVYKKPTQMPNMALKTNLKGQFKVILDSWLTCVYRQFRFKNFSILYNINYIEI